MLKPKDKKPKIPVAPKIRRRAYHRVLKVTAGVEGTRDLGIALVGIDSIEAAAREARAADLSGGFDSDSGDYPYSPRGRDY